jgi:predicted RNase H-like nuclease
LEVFPHAITVALLGAERVLRYKKGRLAARAEALEVFRALLHGHASFEALAARPELAENVIVGTGRALKDREDRLDAMACALAAFHAWRYGLDDSEVFGDAINGYIAVPRGR